MRIRFECEYCGTKFKETWEPGDLIECEGCIKIYQPKIEDIKENNTCLLQNSIRP